MQNYPVQFKLAKRREITISRKESKRISRIEIYEKVRELASKMEVNKEPLTLENFICLSLNSNYKFFKGRSTNYLSKFL